MYVYTLNRPGKVIHSLRGEFKCLYSISRMSCVRREVRSQYRQLGVD